MQLIYFCNELAEVVLVDFVMQIVNFSTLFRGGQHMCDFGRFGRSAAHPCFCSENGAFDIDLCHISRGK